MRNFATVLTGLVANVVYGCEKYYANDCQDIQEMGFTHSGVYNVTPLGTYGGTEVYCDMDTDGGGWLVFQRRQDGSVDFYKSWTEYRRGFGHVSGEHWLGNQALYTILHQGHYELRIDLEDWENNTAFARFEYFKIGDPIEFYKLTVAEYSGSAGDSLSLANGRIFNTRDQGGCATVHFGAWWYKNCIDSDLNGPYVDMDKLTGTLEAGEGLVWKTWKGYYHSLKRTEMKIRRISG